MSTISRRNFLKGSAIVAGAAAVGFHGVFGVRRVFGQMKDDDLQTVLNLAATAETLATTHYYTALTKGGIMFGDFEKAYMVAALEAEQIHLDYLNANGAQALTGEFYFPQGVFDNKATLAAVTEVAENAFIGAYLAATRIFAAADQPLLAMVAAQVAGVEAQHLSFMRGIGGQTPPNNVALLEPIFYNVSDAVPTLTPFLDGKAEGFESMAVAYPGRDKVMEVVGMSALKPVLPATDPDVFKGM
ncbi:MAG: twin-arginine translocation signal domain-containing protein [Chloroflexi bacterium CFX4]|nr:twin-arginine translocation signal domain-containing protein [Chloroflexi bacterium CFX4]MDL1924246.1 ferritin-like domain-containing protein [Chloroflexi bacterium CFX3]